MEDAAKADMLLDMHPAASRGGVSYYVRCSLGVDQDLYHMSLLHAGLCELAVRGKVDLTFAAPRAPHHSGEALTAVEARCSSGGGPLLLAVDLFDRSDTFQVELLRDCHLYFKRSFDRAGVRKLPTGLQQKVVPFGLNYACRSSTSTARVLAAVGPGYFRRLLRSATHGVAGMREEIRILRQFLESPLVAEFEQDPQAPVESAIVFQTRVWEPGTASDNLEEVNGLRAAVVRALRRAFPGRFRGGLVPTAFARKCYPDLLSPEPCRRSRYLAFSKRCLIGVNTRGLHHSLPFKLPEYMAASMCVVSGPLRNEVPAPLVAGRHYLGFDTAEQCVELCEEILRRPELAAEMRRANWSYYQAEVRPEARVANMLERAFGTRSAHG